VTDLSPAGAGDCAKAVVAANSQTGRMRATDQDLMKMPLRFISSCCGFGEKRTLPLVARYAQHWNYAARLADGKTCLRCSRST